MTTTEHTAQIVAEVWTLMLQEADPMPVWAARDYVMDKVGCERGEVLGILVDQACDELRNNRPDGQDGNAVLAHFEIKNWRVVSAELETLLLWHKRAAHLVPTAHLWERWVKVVAVRVELLKELQRAD